MTLTCGWFFGFWRGVLIVSFASTTGATVAFLVSRFLCSVILAKLAVDGRFDKRVAVFGAGPIARRVHDYLKSPGLGVYFAGVFDDRAGQERLNPEGLVVTGKIDDLVAHCRAGKIDQIIVALPPAADQRIADVIKQFERLPVSTHIVTHISSDLIDTGIIHNVSQLGPIGLLDVKKKR